MTGCDYISNFKGIGFITLLNIFLGKNPDQDLKALMYKKTGDYNAVNSYLKKVDNITHTFRYQIVYDPRTRTLKHLNDFKNKKKLSPTTSFDVNYIGTKFELFRKFVKGELDFKTMEPRTKSVVDFDKMTKFFAYIPQPELGALKNLCEITVNYENFDRCTNIVDKCIGKVRAPYRPEDHINKRGNPKRINFSRFTSDQRQDTNSSISTNFVSDRSSIETKISRRNKKIGKKKHKK